MEIESVSPAVAVMSRRIRRAEGLNLPVADRNRNPAVAMIPGLNPGFNKDPLAGTDRPAAVREKETDCKN